MFNLEDDEDVESGAPTSNPAAEKLAIDRIVEEKERRKYRRRDSSRSTRDHSLPDQSKVSEKHQSVHLPGSVHASSSNFTLLPVTSLPNTRQNKNEDLPWIQIGLIVKVLHKELAGGKYYKSKGRIIATHQDYVAEIEMLDSSDIVRVDEVYLETVIPALQGRVCMVKGTFRGEVGILQDVDVEHFQATLVLDSGKVLESLEYDTFCKIYS